MSNVDNLIEVYARTAQEGEAAPGLLNHTVAIFCPKSLRNKDGSFNFEAAKTAHPIATMAVGQFCKQFGIVAHGLGADNVEAKPTTTLWPWQRRLG